MTNKHYASKARHLPGRKTSWNLTLHWYQSKSVEFGYFGLHGLHSSRKSPELIKCNELVKDHLHNIHAYIRQEVTRWFYTKFSFISEFCLVSFFLYKGHILKIVKRQHFNQAINDVNVLTVASSHPKLLHRFQPGIFCVHLWDHSSSKH